MPHPVVLVNEDDRPLGTADKLEAHAEGWLHRAFSVFVFDPTGRLLLQRRTGDKYHSGGLWSNTCCSHPRPEEAPVDAAHRRLPEELGFTAPLTPAFQDRYELSVGDNLVEHEHNHVFIGTADAPHIRPSADEVDDWAWISPSALRDDVVARPHRYTAWFRHLLPSALAAAPSTSGDPSASAPTA
ncbi:isopentenyl-diphosphate Delta-isomerase [Salinibacter grassmerensis]|uniref:isopentenyl-diphosphate Delta-isomerase n=1 Tax=Salinibacter grassmerensis TaxID=3040353 RepID=UPI0021E7FBA8|nr:isopentenyl-diphosphate Delta-isomerase [Salinibacter grassmerensis]